jgi:hypothetical protein
MMTSSIELPPEVIAYFDGVDEKNSRVFDQLHALALATIPGVVVIYSYNMPAYLGPAGRVSLSSGDKGVSIATRIPEPIERFHAAHPEFKTGKVTVLFPADADIPEDAVAELMRAATT